MVINIQKFTSEPRDLATCYLDELERLSVQPEFSHVTFLYLRIRAHWLFNSDRSHLKIVDSDGVKAACRGERPVLVLDLSWEGVEFSETLGENIKDLMDALDLMPEQVVFVQTSEAFADQLAASEAPRAVKGIRLAWFHAFLRDLALAAETERHFDAGHEMIERRPAPERMFLCLNATPRPPRAALLYYIARHPQRARFHCTFHSTAKGKAAVERATRFAVYYLSPYVLDVTPEEVAALVASHPFDPSGVRSDSAEQLLNNLEPDLYAATRLSIVTETEMTDGDRRRFTEKSIKPLVMGHPLVVFGNPGVLRQLEALGFDVLRDLVPSDYDEIVPRRERFAHAVKVVDALLEADVDPTGSAEIRARLHHNVAQFEGPLLARVRRRAAASLSEALAPYRTHHALTG